MKLYIQYGTQSMMCVEIRAIVRYNIKLIDRSKILSMYGCFHIDGNKKMLMDLFTDSVG